MARLVGDPFLVHVVMVARQDAHHRPAPHVDADVGAERVHHVNALGLLQLPRAGVKGIGLVGQRADRAEVDHIALHLAVEIGVQIGSDLRVLAPAGLAHLGDAANLRRKAHAAGAGDAARHLRADKRAEIDVVHGALRLAEAGEVDAVGHRLILKVALAPLIADRAVERVVDQEELHHAFARLLHHRRVGEHLRRLAFRPRTQIAHLHGARGGGLRRAALHFDKAHAAVASDGEAFVVAKPRDFLARDLTGLKQGHGPVDFNLDAVDFDFAKVGHALTPPPRPTCGPSVSP